MTASALAEDRERALASGMNAHITKPIHVESMLRTMAQWISGPGGPPPGEPLQASAAGEPADPARAIDTAAGLSFCMGNEDLYRRLLDGFRRSEAGFIDELRTALAEQRWGDALRRSHDMKGLAGTIVAPSLLAAAQALHAALTAQRETPRGGEVERVGAELDRVLAEIEQITPRG